MKLNDLLGGIGSVSLFTKVCDFVAQDCPIGPLKTTLTVNACQLFVQFVKAGVIVNVLPRTSVDGLIVFSAYRQEME